MGDTIVVALPSVDDKVYKISSEKVPHLTLAYLGEQSDADQLAEVVTYVQHAASQLSPFGLTVDYRGTLGADEADVVFFENGPFDAERIKDFRHHLLMSDTIKKMYDSTEQFPEWTPHLTLGYPETPANEDDSDYPGIHYVQFDRIAVWMGDFDGPEFRLKYADYPAMEVSMSDMTTAELGALAASTIFGTDPDAAKQYGVKGMRWGQRKDEPKGDRGKIRRAITKANVATDAGAKVINEGEKKLIFLPKEARAKAASATQGRVLGEAHEINKQAKYKGKDLKRDPALKEAYFKEVEAKAVSIYKEELTNQRVEVAANVIHSILSPNKDKVDITAPKDRIRHADDNEVLLTLHFEVDDLGQIEDVGVLESHLAHYGVKGMRWGVTTKDKAAQRTPQSVTVTQEKPGKFAKTSGGGNHPLHPDAATALVARQKAKKSTTDALSNQEIKAAVERMQLEQKFAQLEFANDRRSKGHRFLAGFFGQRKEVKFKDMDEENGEKIRKGIDAAMAARAAAKVATAA